MSHSKIAVLSNNQFCFWIVLLMYAEAAAISTSELFSIGPDQTHLPTGDDKQVQASLQSPFPFFGVSYTSLGVSQ